MKKDELLYLYQDYSDLEILNLFLNAVDQYQIIEQSEMIAKSILERNGITFYLQHEGFKKNIRRLAICAKIRKININSINYSEITTEDIIERIRENEARDFKNLSEDEFKKKSILYEQIILKYESLINEGKIFK